MFPVLIFTAVVLGILLLLFILAGSKYKDLIAESKADFQLAVIAAPSLFLIDKLRIMERYASRLISMQNKIAILYPGKKTNYYTRMYLAQVLSIIFLCLLGGGVLGLLTGGDPKLLYFGIGLSVILPYALIKKLAEKTEKRKKDIIFELPEYASKVALLVGAGETVQNAIIRCTVMRNNDPNPLYMELNDAVTRMKNGESFARIMEELTKRCGVQEVSIFTTTILLNYRRGGSELSAALREISRDLWEKRKAISKTRGEEASSKMVFPMVLIFFAVLVMIAYPALKIFG